MMTERLVYPFFGGIPHPRTPSLVKNSMEKDVYRGTLTRLVWDEVL